MKIVKRATAIAALAAGFHCAHAQGQSPMAFSKTMMERGLTMDYSPDTILVRFKSGISESRATAAATYARSKRVERFGTVPGLELVQATDGADAALARMRNHPDVLYAEPNYVVKPNATPNDASYNQLWALRNSASSRIFAPQAWDIFTGGSNFVVAVIDTGTDINHLDLAPNIWRNTGEVASNGVDDDGNGYIDDVRGWDFYANDNNPGDNDGHGTHVAGTIGAVGNNGIGVAGINWNVKIMPLRFMGPEGGFTSDAVRALNYAVAKGVKVSNNSWGSGGNSQSMRDAINASKSVGHIFVAAAGNDGVNIDSTPSYPASYNLDNIIAVAAVDQAGGRASFSNYGATSVDLGAPGVDIYSTLPNNSFGGYSGTSMASPHVAGVVALLYAYRPTWTYSAIRSRVLGNVRTVNSMQGATSTGGVLDAYAVMNIVELPPTAPTNATVTKASTGVARVRWTDTSSNETSFEMQRERYYYYTWRPGYTRTLPANTTVVNDTSGVGIFRYRVRAVGPAGASAWTNWVQIRL